VVVVGRNGDCCRLLQILLLSLTPITEFGWFPFGAGNWAEIAASSDGVTVFACSNDVGIYRSTDQVGWVGLMGARMKAHVVVGSKRNRHTYLRTMRGSGDILSRSAGRFLFLFLSTLTLMRFQRCQRYNRSVSIVTGVVAVVPRDSC